MAMERGDRLWPFIRDFYGRPSSYLWENDRRVIHDIPQGEGGEQGDPLMPLLFSLGLHKSLKSISNWLLSTEKVFAFLDDIYLVCRPNRVAAVYQELQRHTNIDIHCGKTKIWNRCGEKPSGVDQLTMTARVQDPGAIVWRGDHEIPASEQGMKVLGAPMGRDEYTTRFLEKKSEQHDILFQRIPMVPDVQASWLLLTFCAATRANFYLRNTSPEVARPFATSHYLKVHHCLCQIIGVDPDDVSRGALQQSTLPFHLGGLGLASAVRTRDGAHWASWADAVSTIHKKDPDLAATILAGLHSEGEGCFAVANQCAERLVALGVELPTWDAVVAGATPDHIHNTPVEDAASIKVGSSTSPTQSRRCSTPRQCGHLWTRTRELWRCLRVVLWQGSHSTAFPRVTRLEWIQKSSVHCSSVASGCHCPSTHAFANMAVSQTALAIIGLRVLSQVLWSGEVGCCGTHLSRGRSKGLDQRDGP